MGVSIKDLKGRVKRRIRTVTLCLDGDLWAQHDELTAKLTGLRKQSAGLMSAGADVAAAEESLQAVEDAMREASVTLEFRGISSYQLAEIQARFPTESGRGWDVNAGAAALIAACAVEPTTEEEARELLEAVNYADSDKLFAAAWDATTRSDDVPFSARASALMAGSGSK